LFDQGEVGLLHDQLSDQECSEGLVLSGLYVCGQCCGHPLLEGVQGDTVLRHVIFLFVLLRNQGGGG